MNPPSVATHADVIPTSTANGDKKSLYVLYHRRKSELFPKPKFFWHNGDLRSSIERGKRHCEEIGEVFLMVRPFISDLEFDEKRHRGEL